MNEQAAGRHPCRYGHGHHPPAHCRAQPDARREAAVDPGIRRSDGGFAFDRRGGLRAAGRGGRDPLPTAAPDSTSPARRLRYRSPRSAPRLDRAVDPFWVSRQSLESSDGVLKPGCGWLPPSWLPEDGIRRALRSLSRADGAVLADYGSPLGLPALRQLPGPAHGRARHRVLTRPDHADGIRDTGDGPPVPFPARARRHGARRRSLLLQLPGSAARPPRQDRQRSLYAVRSRHRAASTGPYASIVRGSTSRTPRSTIRPARRCRP